MTAYENLKRKEEILSEASLRAESPDMRLMWLMKSKELQKKAKEMTIKEAEKEALTAKEPSQMNKNKRGFLTTFAKRALYNLFCLVVVLAVLLCLCCDWAEVFYPIG